MENEEELIVKNYFKTSYKKEDVSKLPAFKKWKAEREREGNKIVRCPHCWGYEIFIAPTNHFCAMCNGKYCQYCLKPCVEDEYDHHHDRSCCQKFCYLMQQMIDFGCEIDCNMSCFDIFKISMIFIFGNPIMYTYKYYKFFNDNKIIENDCVHGFYKFMNLLVNILTVCSTLYITYLEFFLLLFVPSIIPCYLFFIVENWEIAIEGMDVGETPLLELTVRGKGYGL